MPFRRRDRQSDILGVLDECADAFTFPMLDNGYVYLAGTRLSLHRSPADWALVIEVFGFSPRVGAPDLYVSTFARRLHDRDAPDRFANREAHVAYLTNHPHDESRFFFPFDDHDWQDPDTPELLAIGASNVRVRGRSLTLPELDEYERFGINLEVTPRIATFEACRYLADAARNEVLASPTERRVSVRPEIEEILVLDQWNHPDLVNDERPSQSATFQQLADVLVTGDSRRYRPSAPANTHWRNWPDGGRL